MGEKGSGTCSVGELILDETTCRDACKFFSLPERKFKSVYNICYKDRNGDCYQNGKNLVEAVPICKIPGKNYRSIFDLGVKPIRDNVVEATSLMFSFC